MAIFKKGLGLEEGHSDRRATLSQLHLYSLHPNLNKSGTNDPDNRWRKASPPPILLILTPPRKECIKYSTSLFLPPVNDNKIEK